MHTYIDLHVCVVHRCTHTIFPTSLYRRLLAHQNKKRQVCAVRYVCVCVCVYVCMQRKRAHTSSLGSVRRAMGNLTAGEGITPPSALSLPTL
jgi:hypothetical protein